MESSLILYDKNNTKIVKLYNGNYNIFFSIENKNINLSSVINFSLIKLIYDLNQDICEKVNLENQDENNAIITVIIKNMFKDLGLPQKYSCLQIIKSIQNNSVVFDLITKSDIKPDWIPNDVEIVITHGPAHGVNDYVSRGENVGDIQLYNKLCETTCKLFLCGHIHEAYGVRNDGKIYHINAATCNLQYEPINNPVVFNYGT